MANIVQKLEMAKNCECGSCGHETTEECFSKECKCCLPDHLGAFGKNR